MHGCGIIGKKLKLNVLNWNIRDVDLSEEDEEHTPDKDSENNIIEKRDEDEED